MQTIREFHIVPLHGPLPPTKVVENELMEVIGRKWQVTATDFNAMTGLRRTLANYIAKEVPDGSV